MSDGRVNPPASARARLPGWFALASVCAALSACSAAPPVDLGSDVVVPPETELTPPALKDPDAMVEVFNVNEPFVGGASGYCQSSFQPCGGRLEGTSWVVEDTCTALAGNRRALQVEGSQLIGLDEDACFNSVRRLTSRWSGRLMFETVFATDERHRARRFDLELTPECFTATFGVEPSMQAAAALCESLSVSEDATCTAFGSACRCSALTMDSEDASGVYDVSGNRVSIWGETVAATYDYCVRGSRLLWGKPGTNQHIVLRQRDAAEVPRPGPDQPH